MLTLRPGPTFPGSLGAFGLVAKLVPEGKRIGGGRGLRDGLTIFDTIMCTAFPFPAERGAGDLGFFLLVAAVWARQEEAFKATKHGCEAQGWKARLGQVLRREQVCVFSCFNRENPCASQGRVLSLSRTFWPGPLARRGNSDEGETFLACLQKS